MRKLMIACVLLAGCSVEIADLDGHKIDAIRKYERPTVGLPYLLRQANWTGREREGSCVWATLTSLMRWQGRYHTAEYLKRKYGDGEYADRFADRLENEGIRFAQVTDASDLSFIDWACQTRRGCGAVVMGGAHMIAIVYSDDEQIGILDPNDIEHVFYVPREAFLTEFVNSGGWSFAPVYTPAPPLP